MSEHERDALAPTLGSLGVPEAPPRHRPRGKPADGLGEFVRRTRERQGLSQARAARMAGLSKTTWQQLEGGGGATARNVTLHCVAHALGLEAAVLFNLREGSVTLQDAATVARSRDEVMSSIERLLEACDLTDLLALEEDARVRAKLRRLQRAGDERPER